MQLLNVFLFASALSLVSGDYCFDEKPGFSIPFLSAMTPQQMGVKFMLFTCSNKDTPANFNYLSEVLDWQNSNFDANAKTIFIIHGYQNRYPGFLNYNWMQEMKDLFLSRQCVNVVAIDWSKPAGELDYSRSAKNSRIVGQMIGCVINRWITQLGVSADNIQLVGHSLGAMIAGFAGKTITGTKIGLIVGLDPAGPDFYDVSDSDRLNASDAQYVLNIHSNTGHSSIEGFGHPDALGNIDFFPNGGHQQPGCGVSVGSFLSIGSLQTPIACNHLRSIKYSIADQNYESPQNCQIIGYRCQSYDDFKLGKCADCGADGSGCKPMPFTSDYWEDKSNYDSALVKKQFFVDTGSVDNPSAYCLNHYQIVVNLKASTAGRSCFGDITLRLLNGKQIDIRLESKNTFQSSDGMKSFTKLLTESKSLQDLSSAQITYSTVKSDCLLSRIDINYMSSIDDSVRKTKSSTLCPTDGNNFGNNC